MITIHTDSLNDAWRRTLVGLFESSIAHESARYARDLPAAITIDAPPMEPVDPLFPMDQRDIDVINRYIVTGDNEGSVVHEWTKLYYHRMFDEPYSQIAYMVRMLNLAEVRGGCQVSLWDKTIDQDAEISPCTQILWARRRNLALDFHVHAHSSDAYKKLLMNINEFVAVHQYLAARTGLLVGRYIHFIDSCHIYREDIARVAGVVQNGAGGIKEIPANT